VSLLIYGALCLAGTQTLFILAYFTVVLGGGKLWHLQKFLEYIIFEFISSIILLYLSLFPFLE
jgi:hypothetical protein